MPAPEALTPKAARRLFVLLMLLLFEFCESTSLKIEFFLRPFDSSAGLSENSYALKDVLDVFVRFLTMSSVRSKLGLDLSALS